MIGVKRLGLATVAAIAATSLSGCDYENLNSVTLPGDKGTGEDSYEVRIELRNALNIVPNSPVRVADLNVGTIRSIELVDNQPVVTISLEDSVDLPANVTAKIGQTSLLGAKHIELLSPAPGQARGELADGDVIPLERSGSYPETEDVIASAAALLNGGGLAQIKTITTELNKTLGGREGTMRQLLRRSARFATGLDQQKHSIVRGLDALNSVSGRFADNNDVINEALRSFPPALRVLARDRARLVRMMTSMGQFGRSMSDLVDRGGQNLVRNLAALRPAMKGLADADKSLTDSLWTLGTLVFPLKSFDDFIRGDWLNFWLTVDVGLDSLDRAMLTGTPLAGMLTMSENLLGKPAAGLSSQAGNPLMGPAVANPDATPHQAVPGPTGGSTSTTPEGGPSPNDVPDSSPLGGLLGGLLGGKSGANR